MGLLIVLGRCLVDVQFREDVRQKKPGTLKDYWLTDQECEEVGQCLREAEKKFGEIPIPTRWRALNQPPQCCQNPPC